MYLIINTSIQTMVSIITPAFNASKTIFDTYYSLKSQTFEDWEWIVVDDCSTDNTFEIISEIAKKDNRVVLIRNCINSGAAQSRNAGISRAKGRYIAFIDSDDLWLSEKLAKQLEFMSKHNYPFTFTNYFIVKSSGKKRDYCVKRDFVTYKNILRTNPIGCSTVVFDSFVLGKQYMPTDSPKREDHAAWLDILKKSEKAYRLPESLTLYRVGNKSVSSNKFKMIKYQYRMYRDHEKFNCFKALWYTFIVSINKVLKTWK